MLSRTRTPYATAFAPIAAFAATSLLLFLGLVGAFMTFSLMVATSSLGAMQPLMAPVSRTATALMAGFGSCAFGGLGSLVLVGQCRAGIGADGRFTVRSWPPGRVRTIDLHLLEHIGSRRGPPRRGGLLAATEHSTILALRDRHGATLLWNPAFWRGSKPVTAALRSAAFDCGATVDPGALLVLDDPPLGRLGRLGRR